MEVKRETYIVPALDPEDGLMRVKLVLSRKDIELIRRAIPALREKHWQFGKFSSNYAIANVIVPLLEAVISETEK